jgi:hypothetical protein
MSRRLPLIWMRISQLLPPDGEIWSSKPSPSEYRPGSDNSLTSSDVSFPMA